MKHFGNKIILVILTISILFFAIFDYKKYISNKFKISIKVESIFKDKNNNYRFIAHAGGGIDKIKYTNSLEAINNSIKNGYNLIEIDLIETSDKKLVAAHDWDLFKKITNCCDQIIPDLKEFNSSKILKKYTPVDYNKINNIFLENENLILVTDKTNNFDLINNLFNFDKNRIIVEIFGRKNYFEAIKKGIKNPLYSASIENTKNEIDFILDYKIKMISVNSLDFIKNINDYKKLKQEGVIIFVYTSNDLNFIEKNKNYIDSFYSDFININSMRCESSDCRTY